MAHVNPVQLQKFLKGVDYPASKAELVENAKNMGADEDVCATLQALPDEDYQTPADVSQAFGSLPGDPGKERVDKNHAAGRAQKAPAKGHKEKAEVKAGGHRAQATAGRQAAGEERAPAKQEKPAAGEEPAHAARTRSRHTGGNEFLIQAMQDSMAEIQICEIAIEKSANPDVKAFAQSMIDEHGRMGRELEKLAVQKKLDVPRQIRAEQEMTVDELSSLDGRDFEQRWIQYNIDVHERDIKVFNHYAGEEPDADIRKMAQDGATTFGQHLKMAHDLGRRLAKA